MITGNCLCQGVRFEIDGALEPIQMCPCKECRRAQCTRFVTNIPVATSALRIVAGEHLLKAFESSPGKQRVFCSECGSPILSRRDSQPDVMRIRAGALNEAIEARPAFHIFVSDKANWWQITDQLPQFEDWPK